MAVAAVRFDAGQPEVGVDVVSTRERDGDEQVRSFGGWDGFVSAHAPLLAADEVDRLRRWPGCDGEKRRALLALWCLREAYVKMCGEALLAPWLADLCFTRFRPTTELDGDWSRLDGEEVGEDELGIMLGGEPVRDVRMRLKALARGFMVCVAVKHVPDHVELGKWRWVGLEDILAFAESNGAVDSEQG